MTIKIIPHLSFLICLMMYINFSISKKINRDVAQVIGTINDILRELERDLKAFKNEGNNNIFGEDFKRNKRELQSVRANVGSLKIQTDKIENHVQHRLHRGRYSPEHLERELEIHEFQHNVNRKIGRVVALHNAYLMYSNEKLSPDETTLINFLDSIVGADGDSVESLLLSIHSDIVGRRSRDYSLLDVLSSEFIKDEDSLCSIGRSIQLIIFDACSAILLVEYMATSMTVFGLHKENPTADAYQRQLPEQTITAMGERLRTYSAQFLLILKDLPRNFRNCDPISQVRDVTYYELDGFSQGQTLVTPKATSESVICYRFGFDRCTPPEYCSDLARKFVHPHDEEKTDCKSTSEKYNVELCHTPNEQKDLITRQYRFFTDGKYGGSYPEDNAFQSCNLTGIPGRGKNIALINNKMRPEQFRYGISTAYVMSNYDDNMVIIGVRFQKRDNIIYLQIKEAELLPYGDIKTPEKDEWLPLPPKNSPQDTVMYLDDEHNQIDLNTALFNSDHVLVVVRFLNPLGSKRVRLVAVGLPFNLKTGHLTHLEIGPEAGCGNDHTKGISMRDPDSPLAAKGKLFAISAEDLFITIQPTSWSKDRARTTIPFFDTQEVAGYPLVPFNGIGLEYRTAGIDYGGYISLKPYTLDVTPMLRDSAYTPQVKQVR